MSAHLSPVPDHPTPPAPGPAPSTPFTRPTGGPVEHDEIVQMVELIRAGLEVQEVADAVARSSSTVEKYLRLILPVEERACPKAVVVPSVRELLACDDFDWRQAMRQVAPPTPIRHIERKGLAGLEAHDLVQFALAIANRSGVAERALIERVGKALEERRLTHDVRAARARELMRNGFGEVQALDAAEVWVKEHYGLETTYYWYGGRYPYAEPDWLDE